MLFKRATSSRLLLVDLLPDAAVLNPRTISYPFVMGLSQLIGWQASWCVLGVKYAPDLHYTLPPEDLALLLAEVKRQEPRVVVCNECLAEEQLSAISAAVPGVRLVYWRLTETIESFVHYFRVHVPEAHVPLADRGNLLARIRPIYSRQILNHAPWAVNPLVEVVGGTRCLYHAPVARNPFYRGLQLPAKTMGCSFCYRPPQPSHDGGIADPLEFAVRQIEALCQQRPTPGAEKRVNLTGVELWRRFEELVRALVQHGVRAVELNLSPRLDELLEARQVVERCLPLLAEAAMALRINGMGVENFSPDENMRLHKGITAAQVHEATSFLIECNARWPAQFRLPFGGLGMILFTPWTTLRDLRINLENIERCPLIDRACALGRRLMLFPDAPITLLAGHDGLLVRAGESVFYNAGCKVEVGQDEIPWRFACPEIGILWNLARRISSDRYNIPETDPEKQAAEVFIREAPPGPFDPLPLFRTAIDTIERLPGIGSTMELIEALHGPRPALEPARG
jgi:hypothetical protein